MARSTGLKKAAPLRGSQGAAAQNLADDLIDAVARWQKWLRHERRVSDHTVASYRFDMENLFNFLSKHRGRQLNLASLAILTLSDFRSWLAHNAAKEIEASSRARAVAGVRSFFRWLDRTGQLHNGAIELLKLPKTQRRLPRPVSIGDASEIMSLAADLPNEGWIGLRDEALFTLLYGAGMRISEALGITREALVVKTHVIVTGKGNKQRNVPLLPVLHVAIEKYLAACPFAGKPDKPIFVGARGETLNPAVAQRHMRALRRQLNLPDSVTPHALRHSFATHMLSAGADLRSLQELLGHSSLSTTQLYTQIDSQQLAQTYRAAHPRARIKSRST